MTGYASPWRSEELELFSTTARRFMERRVKPYLSEWAANGEVDRQLWRDAGAAGLLCCSVPIEYGGGGAPYTADLVVVEEMHRVGAVGWGNMVHSGIVAHYLLHLGTPEQKERWLPRLVSGDLVGAICMTEPNTGSDLQAIATRAESTPDGWLLNGSKTFVSNGAQAGLFIIVASTRPESRGKGLSLFVVEADLAQGLQRGRKLDKIGHPSADTSEIFLNDVGVPRANLLGVENEAFVHLMHQLPQERLLIGLAAVVSAERAVREASAYVKERQAFGKTLWDLQHVRFELAECATLAHVARTLVDSCICRHLDGGIDVTTSAMLKWWSTEVQCQVTDRCLQLFGGYGYTRDYPIGQMFVDARVQKIYGGANEVLKELVARSL
jgi:acyl-CoA dehydrogenase